MALIRRLREIRFVARGIFRRWQYPQESPAAVFDADYDQIVVNDRPVAYYPLSEPSGTNANDASVNNNDGTYTNTPTLGVVGPVDDLATATSFDDAQSEYVTAPNTATNDLTGSAMSIEFWYKATTVSTYGLAVGKNNGQSGATQGWFVRAGNDTPPTYQILSIPGVDNAATVLVLDGAWHHFVGTYDGARIKAYHDGVLGDDWAATGSITSASAYPFLIAQSQGNDFWDGSIAKVALYDYALDQAQIDRRYARKAAVATTSWKDAAARFRIAVRAFKDAATRFTVHTKVIRDVMLDTPDVFYRLNETSGALKEFSGGADGTAVNSPTYAQNGLADADGSLRFDGSSYVELGDVLDRIGTASFSLEAWVRPTGVGAFPTAFRYVFRKLSTDGLKGYGLYWHPTRGFGVDRIIDPTYNDCDVFFTGGTVLSHDVALGLAHHVVGTYDGTNLRLYVDGELRCTLASSLSLPNLEENARIGQSSTASTFGFIGEIEKFAAYSVALSQTRIRAHYRSGQWGATARLRFRLVVRGYTDAATRFVLSVPGTFRDVATRFVLVVRSYKDAATRLRIIAQSYKDAAARLVVTARTYRDAATRFVLNARAYRDVATRFSVAVGAYKDVAARLRVVGLSYKDVATRFVLTATSTAFKDAQARFKTIAGAYEDVALRFRLEVRAYRDVAARLRLIARGYKDATARLHFGDQHGDRAYRYAILSAWEGALAGYWRLGESSGATAVDSSGKGLDATYSGTVAYGEPGAMPGTDTAMGGGGGGKASRSTGVINPSYYVSGYAVEFWVKVPVGEAITVWPVSLGTTGTDYPRFCATTTVARPLIYLSADNWRYGSSDLRDGRWHYVLMYVAGSGTSDINNAEIWIDGVQETYPNTSASGLPATPTGAIHIGDMPSGWGLDEVAVYEGLIGGNPISDPEAGVYRSAVGFQARLRFRLIARSYKDVATRFVLTTATTTYKDVAARFRIVGSSIRDAATRFVLTVRGYKDVATRLAIVVRGYRDIATRLRIVGQSYTDVATRFVLTVVATSFRDAAIRVVVQARSYTDAAARFRLDVRGYRDIQSRAVVVAQSVRDAPSRFVLTVQTWVFAPIRFVLTARSYRDVPTRVVLIARGYTDAATRFVLAIAVSRLYLRDLTSLFAPTAGSKSATLPIAAGTDNSGATFESLSMLPTKGVAQTTREIDSDADANHHDQYIARYASPLLAPSVTQINAGTWTIAIALSQENADANSELMMPLYVWRPSTASVVGFIHDAHTALGAEWSPTEDGIVTTLSGAQVTGLLGGDVIVAEVWRHTAGQG